MGIIINFDRDEEAEMKHGLFGYYESSVVDKIHDIHTYLKGLSLTEEERQAIFKTAKEVLENLSKQ